MNNTISKQDRTAPRTASDIERKYNFGKTFAELIGAAQAAQDAAEKAQQELDSLTAEEVFNILTDGGTTQGIYRLNGKIYLNASYIRSGLLVADLIKAGVLQSNDGTTFYLDLNNGILRGRFDELSIGGKNVATADDLSAFENSLTEDLNAFEDSVTKDIANIQSQLDGNITTWFYNYVPTATNAPAVNWTTEADKNLHLGDLFYVVDNATYGGFVYRWALINDTYQWTLVEDSEVAKALADAAEAKDIADGKRRVFVSTPTPPYDVGDLWAQGSQGDLMRCKTARSTGSYQASDWELASKYIDAVQAGNIAQGKVDSQTQLDVLSKLTNGFTDDGIFLRDGRLYVSASAIRSGELLADLITAGVLRSKDGEMVISLDGGEANFFNGINTNGLAVRDGMLDNVDLFKVETENSFVGKSAKITARNAAGNDIMTLSETVSTTDANEFTDAMFKIKSPNGVYTIELLSSNSRAYIALSKNGVGAPILSINESGETEVWPDKILGKKIVWQHNVDGTLSLVGYD